MVKEVFRDVPHVELLQWLARGSLKQNLLRASDRYIKDTERHDTFEEISYQQAQRLIERYIAQSRQKKNLPDVLTNCSPNDAYYQVFIRYQDSKHRDNNVIMRLRAWRPRCEVLLPFDLRQSIAEDVAKEYQLYHTLSNTAWLKGKGEGEKV